MKPSEPKLCPSGQPNIDGSVAFAVVDRSDGLPRATWIETPVPVTADLLAMTGAVSPTQVFRFASACQEKSCLHFDGTDCRLAARIVGGLDQVTVKPPPCTIRQGCRWFGQEGVAACLRCPQIATEYLNPSAELQAAAHPEPRR